MTFDVVHARDVLATEWMENECPVCHRVQDDRLPRDFYTVCAIRRLVGITWNHYDKPPSLENTPTLEQVESLERS